MFYRGQLGEKAKEEEGKEKQTYRTEEGRISPFIYLQSNCVANPIKREASMKCHFGRALHSTL